MSAQRAPELIECLHQTVLFGTEASELSLELLSAKSWALLLRLQGLLGGLVELGLLFGEAEHLLHGFAKAGGCLGLG